MDEKWKISKKEVCNSGSSSKFALPRSFSSKSVSSKAPLLRSSSQKSSSSSNKSPLPRSFSQKSSSISRKCSSLAKEQKARFYIMRRCVAMLVCWHKHGDSWRGYIYICRSILQGRSIPFPFLWFCFVLHSWMDQEQRKLNAIEVQFVIINERPTSFIYSCKEKKKTISTNRFLSNLKLAKTPFLFVFLLPSSDFFFPP